MYVSDWLAKRALLTPEKVALFDVDRGERLAYAEMNRQANRLAHFLRAEMRLEKGDRVAILAPNCPEYLEAFFAAAKIGAVLVPINSRLAAEEIRFIVEDCRPKGLIFSPEYAAVAALIAERAGVGKLLMIDTVGAAAEAAAEAGAVGADTAAVASATAPAGTATFTGVQRRFPDSDPERPSPDLSMDDPHAILYTGGTTGRPKGAILTHGNIHWNSINTIVSWSLRDDDVAPVFTPFFHTGGLNVLTNPLIYLGGTLVLPGKFDPDQALKLIAEERMTIVFMVPTMFQMMMERPSFAAADFRSVRFFISGGAPCPLPIYEAYWKKGAVFKQGYGLTEAGPNNFFMHADDTVRKAGAVGHPMLHVDMRIVDDGDAPVRQGEVGELLIRGPHVSPGYWNNPEATNDTIRDGWLHTGDLARQDEDGFYHIVGRKKDMFISGGENVYPVEIENALYAHPAVAEAAVVGVADPKWGEVGKAVIVLKQGASWSVDEVLKYLRSRLARYKVPKKIEFRAELPKSSAGKILKRLLVEDVADKV